jgi:predicted PurR-regulated permease PerM
MNQSERILDISWQTILKISITGLAFYILFLTRDFLVWFLFALILSILFNPGVDFLQKRRVPRAMAVIFIYLAVFGILSLSIYSVVPVFIVEVQQFSQGLPSYFEKISPPLRGLGFEAFGNLESFITALDMQLKGMAANIFNALFSIFGGIFATLFVITVAIFLSLEEKAIEKAIALFFPKKYEAYALSVWEKSQRQVSGWFGVRVLGSVFVGVSTYIALLLFNVKYPFSLALLAGVLEFIPIVGPLVAGVVAFVLVAADSLLKAIFVLIFFVLVQQVEGNILTPVLTRKFIGLPPALVLVALAVGAKLWGIMGAILTIPLAGIIFEFLKDFLRKRRELEKKTEEPPSPDL